MAYLRNSANPTQNNQTTGKIKSKFYKKKWFKVTLVIVILFVLVGGVFAWKTGSILSKISNGSLMSSLAHSLPGANNQLKGEADGRINVLLLGMRGADLPGGGTLADTIMVASIAPKENKIAMISIPRDLYVTDPGTESKSKINAVHAYGEQKGAGQGIEDMKTIVSQVTGLPIHYAVSIDFAGFKQLVDAIGGVDITLANPFNESVQFNEPHVCDSFFTKPTGKFEYKYHSYSTSRKIVAQYPLCTAPADALECGGNFNLPAGKQTLSGEQALCYARSRATSSDFERAKRQQQIIQLVKAKLLSAGTLTDFGKLNGIMNSLGNNVRTDMQPWEMKKLYDLYMGMKDPQTYQRVLENSEEGLLYTPVETKETGYILLPRGDNYDQIHNVAQNIFTIAPQSDIAPK